MHIRPALAGDLSALVALYADDEIGRTRETVGGGVAPPYRDAFAAIERDPNHVLVVGEIGGRIVATLLLSFLPGLSRGGNWRAQIEAMRVAHDRRGEGLGRALLDWALDRARERGCALVQLTSDTRHRDAHRFYERAGFVPSHTGFKLFLE